MFAVRLGRCAVRRFTQHMCIRFAPHTSLCCEGVLTSNRYLRQLGCSPCLCQAAPARHLCQRTNPVRFAFRHKSQCGHVGPHTHPSCGCCSFACCPSALPEHRGLPGSKSETAWKQRKLAVQQLTICQCAVVVVVVVVVVGPRRPRRTTTTTATTTSTTTTTVQVCV